MDVYALLAERPVPIDVLHGPTMNEAPAYGSSFSRGMALEINGRNVIYVSGTASIDTEGRVLHVGDLEGQVHRMFENVEALLGTRGATFDDVVSAITYLKRPEYLDTFYRIWDERNMPGDIPNTVSVADVCRPEWLCEIEVIAVFPEDRG
jgi:enamine deaminase RidA (YjgF/YER057c/UK114 family)